MLVCRDFKVYIEGMMSSGMTPYNWLGLRGHRHLLVALTDDTGPAPPMRARRGELRPRYLRCTHACARIPVETQSNREYHGATLQRQTRQASDGFPITCRGIWARPFFRLCGYFDDAEIGSIRYYLLLRENFLSLTGLARGSGLMT